MLSLKIKDGYINNAIYEYVGCTGLQACTSALTEMIKRKNIYNLLYLSLKDIIDYLGGIPKSGYECAEIARNTLKDVIHLYKRQGNIL